MKKIYETAKQASINNNTSQIKLSTLKDRTSTSMEPEI